MPCSSMRHMSTDTARHQEASTSGAEAAEPRRTGSRSIDNYVIGKHVLKIVPSAARAFEYALRSDVLNMLEEPSLLDHDVRIEYDTRSWTPRTFFVLYKTADMRDAAIAAAGVNGKTFLGTVPVTLTAGTEEEVQAAVHRSRMLMISNHNASSTQAAKHHNGRVVLMQLSGSDRVDKAFVQDTWLAEFDTVYPHVAVLRGENFNGVVRELPSALIYFAHPDEAARAVRSKHRTEIDKRTVTLRVIT